MLRKVYWFIIIVIAIPLDIIFWNLILGIEYGFITPAQSIRDNWNQFKEI